MQFAVFGPHNTGTNLVQKLLERVGTHHHHQPWKHTLCERSIANLIRRNPDVHLFLMIRHPANWFSGMQKCAYEWNWDKNIEHGCAIHNQEANMEFPSIMDVYKYYCDMYIRFRAEYPGNVRLVSYEMVIHPTNGPAYFSSCIKDIDGARELPLATFKDVLSKPAKRHGSSVQTAAAAYRKTLRPYLHLTPRERAVVEVHQEAWGLILTSCALCANEQSNPSRQIETPIRLGTALR